MPAKRSEVLDYFEGRKQTMISSIQRLVAVESPSSDVAALEKCADELVGYINETTGGKPHVIYAEADGRPHVRVDFGDRTDVLLIGHFDTVHPLGSGERYPSRVEGDRLWGLGALDMKGGLVMITELVRWIQRSNNCPNITVLMNSDEEIGSETSKELIRDLAVDARIVLDFEFTDPTGAMKIGRRGARQFVVTIKGKGGHAAYPELNVNPVDALADVIVSARRYHHPDKGIIVVPTLLKGSRATNVVPDAAIVHFDVRGTTDRQLDDAQKGIERIKLEDERFELSVEQIVDIPTFQVRKDNRAFALAQRAAVDLGLPPPKSIEARGASDANQAALVNPHVLDGLGGWGDGAHSAPREYLSISSIVPSVSTAALMVESALAGDYEARDVE